MIPPIDGTVVDDDAPQLQALGSCPQGNLFNGAPVQPTRWGLVNPDSLVKEPSDA